MGKLISKSLIGSVLLLPTLAAALPIEVLNNGDFELGLAGWTVVNPGNYVADIVNIDIDGVAGSLVASSAFRTQTGGGPGINGQLTDDVHLRQAVSLIAGVEYTFFANIASQKVDPRFSGDGGQFKITIGVEELGFGKFGNLASESLFSDVLSGVFTAGSSGIFDIHIYRGLMGSSVTPYQYLDNISLTYNGSSPTSHNVSEPASIALLGLGFVGLGLNRRKK